MIYSILSNFVKQNTIPFVVGATVGFIGHYAVKWLKAYRNPITALGNFHIIQLSDKGPIVKVVSLAELKNQVPIIDLNDLRKSVDWLPRTEKIWQSIFEKSTHIVCVKKDTKLIGFGKFVGNGRMGTIFDIHVHPEHQKQKIGTMIMNHLVTQIKTQDYTSVGLFAWEENQSVLNFYEKFGFVRNMFAMQSKKQQS